jgi:hypothetical protein
MGGVSDNRALDLAGHALGEKMRRIVDGRKNGTGSSDERSNKGLKLTKPERIGALQLNPGVGRTKRRHHVWRRVT